MNKKIQPQYEKVLVTCRCGNKFETRSTKCGDIFLDICSNCHPFYTGEQRIIDSSGRVDSFKKRFGNISLLK